MTSSNTLAYIDFLRLLSKTSGYQKSKSATEDDIIFMQMKANLQRMKTSLDNSRVLMDKDEQRLIELLGDNLIEEAPSKTRSTLYLMNTNKDSKVAISDSEAESTNNDISSQNDNHDFSANTIVATENPLLECLTRDDLKDMAFTPSTEDSEIKVSNSRLEGLRQRLGLVRESRDYAVEADAATSTLDHDIEKTDMFQMSRQLKETACDAFNGLKDESALLDQLEQNADSSLNQVTAQSSRLATHLESGSIGIWTTVLGILLTFVLFIFMYLFIKLFPKQ